MKLLIGIPTAGSPAKPFLESLAKLELPAGVSSVERITATGNFVPGQRELILRRAAATGADMLAMIDDDIVLPPDALVRLSRTLDEHPGCALAGALYYSRDGLRPMAVCGWNETSTTSAYTPAFDDRTPIEVDGVGFGCVLIRSSALTSLQQPFLATQVYFEEAANRVRICNEDYLFCAKLRRAGHTVMLHPGIRCGHFDRESERIVPRSWEPSSVTSANRMTVAHPDGSVTLAPLDASIPHAKERHVTAPLDYIFTE